MAGFKEDLPGFKLQLLPEAEVPVAGAANAAQPAAIVVVSADPLQQPPVIQLGAVASVTQHSFIPPLAHLPVGQPQHPPAMQLGTAASVSQPPTMQLGTAASVPQPPVMQLGTAASVPQRAMPLAFVEMSQQLPRHEELQQQQDASGNLGEEVLPLSAGALAVLDNVLTPCPDARASPPMEQSSGGSSAAGVELEGRVRGLVAGMKEALLIYRPHGQDDLVDRLLPLLHSLSEGGTGPGRQQDSGLNGVAYVARPSLSSVGGGGATAGSEQRQPPLLLRRATADGSSCRMPPTLDPSAEA